MKKYKWGILAPGKMSAKFANGLKVLPNAELYAVGSRSIERARKFALDHGFKKSYGTYEELAADPEVDVIYIASPHSFHFDHTMLCLRNGKAVICEKAFGINSREVETMINEAEKRGIFLMEALWPPFQPFYKKASEILESGILGEVKHLHGYFSFMPPFDPADRKFNVSLGGGSLLDIGIYPVIDALTFLGIPDDVRAVALFSETGSEESVSAVFRYNNRCLASVYSSFSTNVGIGCDILCRNGNMTVSRGRDMNQRIILALHGREKQEYVFTPEALGYHWEAEEVMKCLDENKLESTVVPHAFSINLIRTLDRIRQSAGIHFPQDN